MRKTIFLAFLIIFTSASYSQISLKIGPMLGLTAPSGDYGGEAADFYNGTKYGLKSGLHYGLVGKVQLGPLNGRASVSYVTLSNNGNTGAQTNSTVDYEQNILTFSLGTEFGIGIPFTPVRPYAGIDILFSTFKGNFNFQGTPNVPSDERSMTSASRTGLGLAVGAEVGFGKSFMLDLSLRYNILNILGREYSSANTNNRVDSYTNLNDDADPNAGGVIHPIGSSRTISTIQFNAALMFGF